MLVPTIGTRTRLRFCILGAFTDRFRDLSCFAAANADQTVFVADDDQRSKAEVTSALYYFGYAVYGNKFFLSVLSLLCQCALLYPSVLEVSPASRAPSATLATRPV